MAKKKDMASRLKEARLAAGLSQKSLGIAAGIDAFVASTRINRYEQGIHEPDSQTMAQLAKALKVPAPYMYCVDDDLAWVILHYSCLSTSDKLKIQSAITNLNDQKT